MNNLAILVNSCDDYEEAWGPFFTLFFKYWKDECVPQIYLNTEAKTYNDNRVVSLHSIEKTWSSRLIEALNKIEEKYVLMLLDDFFVQKNIDVLEIKRIVNILEKNSNIGGFYFKHITRLIKNRTPNDIVFNHYYYIEKKIQKYYFNFQAAVFRKQVLLDMLIPGHSPWQIEEDLAFNSVDFDFLCDANGSISDCSSDVIPYLWALDSGYGICKGKWLWNNRRLFKKNNVEFKINKLGYMRKTDYVLDRLKKKYGQSIDNFINFFLQFLSKKSAHQVLYWRRHKKKMNWNNPTTYDELIHYFIVNEYDTKYGVYADKYKVREFIRECGLGNLLVPLISGPFEKFTDIDFDSLPEEFIIKTNHASGANHYYICTDKNKIEYNKLKKQFDSALREKFWKSKYEYHYKNIKPLLIIEALLHDKTSRMTDYKVVCSYGTPIAILVCSDRDKGRDYFDLNWNPLDYVKSNYKYVSLPPRPDNLTEMINAASILSAKFPLSRIDFYNIDNKVYFGEITLTPSAGYNSYLNDFGQHKLCESIKKIIESRKKTSCLKP